MPIVLNVDQVRYRTGAPPVPTAAFSEAPASGCPPLLISFSDESTGATAWSWHFGDGGTSTLQNPGHTYAIPGTYTVTLTVSNPFGSSSAIGSVHVGPLPSFTAVPSTGPDPFTVSFSDTSSGAVVAWLWDFGDGGTSTLQNPTHTYPAGAAAYTVTLTVTDGDGVSCSTTGSVVDQGSGDCQVLLVNASSGDSFPEYDTPSPIGDVYYQFCVMFPSSTLDDAAVQANWIGVLQNFRSGAFFGDCLFASFDANGPGTGWQWWTCGDFGGAVGSITPDAWMVVGVTFASDGTTTIVVDGTTYMLTGSAGEDTIGVALGSYSFGAYPATFFYDNFTMGSAGFGSPDIFWDDFETGDLSRWTSVTGSAAVAFGSCCSGGGGIEALFSGCGGGATPLAVAFADQSIDVGSTITSWAWNFGDGGTSTLQNPTHTYAAPGDYTVSLTVTDAETRTDTLAKTAHASSSTKVMKASSPAFTPADALKNLSTPATPWYLQFCVYVPQSTLDEVAVCGGSFADTSEFVEFGDGIFLQRVGTTKVWEYYADWAGSPNGTFVADAWHTVQASFDGATMTWKVDGATLFSYAFSGADLDFANLMVGLPFPNCEGAVYLDDFRIGSTPGGTDIFADDFESGTFAAWTSTTGAVSIVGSDSTCGGC